MRVVILTQYFPPEIGAPQNRLLEMVKGLQKRNFEVLVVTAMPNYPYGRIFNGYKWRLFLNEEVETIRVKRFWLFASNSARSIPRIISMLSFTVSSLFSIGSLWKFRPQGIIVESPPLSLIISGWILSKLSKAKLILNISDLWPLSARELGVLENGRLYRMLEGMEQFGYHKSALCLGQSEEIVNHIRSKTESQVTLFRNGVDISRFNVKKREIGTQNLKLVYTGLIGVAQGIHQLCREIDFKSLGIEFHIYGTGPYLKDLQEYIGNHPTKSIFYKGTVSRSEIPQILNRYDAALIMLNKSIYGAVPSKIYEAMAAGMPILFSGNGEGAKIILENNCGWVNDPGNYEALKRNLLEFADSKDLRLIFSENSFKTASEKFDRRIQIEKLAISLNQILT